MQELQLEQLKEVSGGDLIHDWARMELIRILREMWRGGSGDGGGGGGSNGGGSGGDAGPGDPNDYPGEGLPPP